MPNSKLNIGAKNIGSSINNGDKRVTLCIVLQEEIAYLRGECIVFDFKSLNQTRPVFGPPCHGPNSSIPANSNSQTQDCSLWNMNTIVMQIDSAVCNTTNAAPSAPEQSGTTAASAAPEVNALDGASQSHISAVPIVTRPKIQMPITTVVSSHAANILNVEILKEKRSDTQISSQDSSPVSTPRIVSQSSVTSTLVTTSVTSAFSTNIFKSEAFQTSPTSVATVIKDKTEYGEGKISLQENVITSSSNTSTILTPTRTVRGVVQPLNTVELVVKDKREGLQVDGYPISSQKIFNIVPANQKNVSGAIQKMGLNNNNGQRVQTITSVSAVQRGTVSVSGGNPLKVHVVNSKGNIGMKTPLQVQRQVMSNIPAKQMGNGTKAMVKAQMLSNKSNNLLAKAGPLMNNVQKQSYKAMNRSATNPNKTIKTLSPQSPQQNYMKTGIKTLSPQNHMGKGQPPLKMLPNQPNTPRMGIKTLTPQRPYTINNRTNNLTPKPNYIGKHAVQAHKAHGKGMGHQMKGRGQGQPQQRVSPTKYLQQKQGLNAQSSFNQALTAQILQSLPAAGNRSDAFQSNKNYAAAHSPADSNMSDDIGEEVKPEMSPNVNYLYQVVMLDHNYSSSVASMPAVSPTTPTSMGPSSRQPISQQSPAGMNGTPGMPQNYYPGSGKRHRLNSGPVVPPAVTLPITNTVGSDAHSQQDDDATSTISSETHREHPGEEGEETETAPEGEGDEDGITRCICDYDHDDGYMICCDICSSWQHVDCMGLDRAHIPDKYACVRCEPRRVDRAHARAIQQRKREELAASDSGSSGSETSTAESTGGGDARHTITLNNNLITKKRNTNTGAPVPLAARRKSEPPIHQRRQSLAQKRQQQRRESIRETSTNAVGRRTMKKREKKQVMKRKMKSRSSVDDDSQDSWPSPSVPPAPTANVGANLLQLRQWIENYEEAVTNHYSPELRARISNMRANGQSNAHMTPPQSGVVGGVGVPAPPTAQQDVQVQKCRLVPQPSTGFKIVMTTTPMPSNSPVIELRGKYMLSTQHRQVPPGPTGGLLTRQHSQQRPGPFLFFYRLPKDGTEVCVDTRTYGNDARFIRRSCRPNAELRHCVEKGTLHLYVVTVTQVEKNQELTIRHETHDLAAVGTTNISCACGNMQQCGLFHNQRKNGGATVVHEQPVVVESATTSNRKRRGRRTSSPGLASPIPVPVLVEPPLLSPVVVPTVTVAPPPPAPAVTTRRSSHQSVTRGGTSESSDRSQERREREGRIRERETREPEREGRERERERDDREPTTTKEKDKKKKLTREERKMEAIMKAFERLEKAQQRKQEVQARQAQRRESDPTPVSTGGTRQENGEILEKECKQRRKRRKGRARTVSTTSQSIRRRTRVNSTDSYMTSGDEGSLLSPPLPASSETQSDTKLAESPVKSQCSQMSDISSPGQVTTAAGLLLALASGGNQHEQALNKSPPRETDGNSSSSSIQSSPSTPLSSACLLVAAAVGPLEPGFKFPKTKKAIMNEWLNKSPEPIQASSISPLSLHQHSSPVNEQPATSDFYGSSIIGGKSLATLVQAASLCDSPPQTRSCEKGGGNAKKRWLRQAISEECDSPCSRPESPPSEMVAPPKKRRLARESLSSEQSFTPPTTPTMLVPPTNSLAEEDYPNNDEEFYTNEDRSANPSPPDETDFGKSGFESRIKESGRVEIVYSGHETGEDLGNLSEQPEMEPDAVLKERVAEMRMEFGGAPVKREDLSDVILDSEQQLLIPPAPAPSLLDPRLGRCERPMFRDSAQLLGTVEKTIRFYEENFATPAVSMSAEKDEKEKKAEIVTPAKRKLSISEYRQRKQLTTAERQSIEEMNSSMINSPGSPSRISRRRSDSTSSTTSSLSSEEEIVPTPIISGSTSLSGNDVLDKTTGTVGFNSAPTAVELQRENVERLKKAFGLESSTSRDSSVTSPKSLLVSPPTISPANPIITPEIKPETSKYLLSESKFSESIKFLETTKYSDDTKFTEIKFSDTTKFTETKFTEPKFEPKFSETIIETKYSESPSFAMNKYPEPMSTDSMLTETKYSESSDYVLHKISPKKEFDDSFSESSFENRDLKRNADEDKEEISEEKYPRFDDAMSSSFIPPFNNPVYPNSTQFTGFTSVIDSCPYEGRNPSPPPSEILPNTRIPSYPVSEPSSLSMSPNLSYK